MKLETINATRDKSTGEVTYVVEKKFDALTVIFQDSVYTDRTGNRALADGKVVSTEPLRRGDLIQAKNLFNEESIYVIRGIKRGNVGMYEYTITEYETS